MSPLAALARGINTIETKLLKAGEADLDGGNFQDWILCDLARKQAEAMIKGKTSATQPAP